MTLRILLVDDHQMFRDALRMLLEQLPNVTVVGAAGSGEESLGLAAMTAPDIVCMDIGMPGMNGVETTRQLIKAHPALKVIALSTYVERHYVLEMMGAGAAAYVTKAEASDELFRAIDAVQRGRNYLCPDVATLLTESLSDAGKPIASTARLGAREKQVIVLVAKGYTSSETAREMNISPATVEVHRRNAMRKLNLRGVAELTRYVITHGLDRDGSQAPKR